MNPAMEAFTSSLCPEVFHALYQRVYQLVRELQIEEFETELTDLAMSSDLYDPTEAADRYNTIMYNYLREVLQQHDIVISDDATLEDVVTLCEAVLLMQDWDDHDGILRILETLSSNEEKFAEVVYTVTTKSMESVMVIVESVSDAFIAKLQEFHNKETTDDTEGGTTNEVLLQQLKIAARFYNNDCIIFKMINAGVPVGAPLQFYMNMFGPHIGQIPRENLPKEMHCMLLTAEDSYDSVVTKFSEISDWIFDDLNEITKLTTELTRESQKFNTYKLAFTAPSL